MPYLVSLLFASIYAPLYFFPSLCASLGCRNAWACRGDETKRVGKTVGKNTVTIVVIVVVVKIEVAAAAVTVEICFKRNRRGIVTVVKNRCFDCYRCWWLAVVSMV